MTREEVLGNVRRALGRDASQRAPIPEPPELGAVERDQDPSVERFREELQRVSGFVLDGGKDWSEAVRQYVDEEGQQGVFAASSLDAGKFGVHVVDEATARSDPERVLGLSRASWAISASGSVVVEGTDAILPCVLVATSLVLLDPAHIVPTLSDLPAPGKRRMIITGPARTADVEKKIVLGAHGAKRFGVVL